MHVIRKAIRLGGVTVVLTAAVAFFAPQAATAAAAAPVTGGSWFYAAQAPGVPSVGGQNIGRPASVPTPDVPSGDFPVAARAGQSEKESFLHIDTSALPAGSTVSRFVLVLSEDAAAQSLTPDMAKIQAVAADGYFADGAKAAPYTERPTVTPDPKVMGTRGADGTWRFDLTPIVSKWLDGSMTNNGIALVPVTDGGATFQVVWSGTSPPPTTEGEITPAAEFTGNNGSASDVGSAGASESGTSFAAGPAPVSVEPDFGSTPLVPAGPAPAATAAPAGAAPSAAGGAPAAITPTVSTRPSRRPPFTFWLGLIGVLALAAAGAVSLGEWGDPVPARQGSVLRVLEGRAATRQTTPQRLVLREEST